MALKKQRAKEMERERKRIDELKKEADAIETMMGVCYCSHLALTLFLSLHRTTWRRH
jgi:hypothetical protein